MVIEVPIVAILSILAGVIILAAPKLLNYVVALYLIISGIVMLVQQT